MFFMKIIHYFASLCLVAFAIIAQPVFAEETTMPPLVFSAVNAGYKDEQFSQNYDFFELTKTIPDDLDLSSFKIQYFNSSDNLAGELEFPESTILRGNSVVFGFSKSPQFQDASARYLYNFSSSGLASTAGRLRIVQGEAAVDEICWGKLVCEQQLPKFATKQEDNRTAVMCRSDDCEASFTLQDYYPSIIEEAIYIPEPEPVEVPACSGLKITEIYSYYEENSSEQFIELYNSNEYEQDLSACVLRYKNKEYPLQGILATNSYTIVQDILLTKDPSTSLKIELYDGNGLVDSLTYLHGQKRGASFAVFDNE
jgi:hypothetical protein